MPRQEKQVVVPPVTVTYTVATVTLQEGDKLTVGSNDQVFFNGSEAPYVYFVVLSETPRGGGSK